MPTLLFEVETPVGFVVRCTETYWSFIVGQKHPVLFGQEASVRQVLAEPDEVRRSKKDPSVFLFYKDARPRWLCAVVRKENRTGFLITAYPTDTLKVGDTVWTKSR